MLSVVRFANQTVHLFGTVIPTWLAWFLDNWREIFTDVASMSGGFEAWRGAFPNERG